MKDPEVSVEKSPKRRKTIIAFIIAAVSQVLLAVIFFLIPPLIPDFVFAILIGLTFFDIVVISLLVTPNYILRISLSVIFVLIFCATYLYPYPFTATTFRFMELILFMLLALILLRHYDFKTESTLLDERQKKSLKRKNRVWNILLILIGLTLLSIPFTYITILILSVELICLVLFSFFVLKYYDLPLLFFLLIFLGLFTKRLHLALAAEEMTGGTILLSIVALFISLKSLITFRDNPFLKWFGFLAGIIVTTFMMGMLAYNLHWSSMIRMVLIPSGCFMFLIYVFAFVFRLPNSDYIAWSDRERKVFYRAVLIPMVFIFALITLIVVFPDTYNLIMGREGATVSIFPYEINRIELFNLEGILLN